MDQYEQSVMSCLTANGETFVAPQFNLGKGWSCPDLVAIRPFQKKVYVVEVTASGNPVGLVKKVNDRDSQWLRKLREHLEERGITGPDWSYGVLVFLRQDQCKWFKGRIKDHIGVYVLCLEDAIMCWEWSERVWTSNFSFEAGALKRAAQ
jgi:hypothetical protein